MNDICEFPKCTANLSRTRGFVPDVEVCLAQDAWIDDAHLYSSLDPGLCSQEDSASRPHRNGQAARPAQAKADSGRQVVQNELLQSRVLCAIYSQRQLQEVMTDFWLNQFNVFQGKTGEEIYSLVPYERDVNRPNALGSFEVLLCK